MSAYTLTARCAAGGKKECESYIQFRRDVMGSNPTSPLAGPRVSRTGESAKCGYYVPVAVVTNVAINQSGPA